MKKTLLFISALMAGSTFAQNTFTAANEPGAGTKNYYLCDSLADNMATITGANVTWDYSDIAKYDGENRTIIIDATSSSSYASSFPNSNKFWNLEQMTQDFWNSNSTDRVREGIVITEASLGEVIAKFSTDQANLVSYPFAYGDALSDTFEGTVDISGFGFTGLPAQGMRATKYDGHGTLKVGSETVSNVSRLHLTDTIAITTMLGVYNVILEQFEYYDLDTEAEPVFIHTSGTILQDGSTTPMMQYSVVISKYEPASTVSTKMISNVDFNIAPNPVKEQLFVSGEFTNADIQIIDQAGKIIFNGTATNGTVISTSNLVSGVYVIKASVDSQSVTKKIVKL